MRKKRLLLIRGYRPGINSVNLFWLHCSSPQQGHQGHFLLFDDRILNGNQQNLRASLAGYQESSHSLSSTILKKSDASRKGVSTYAITTGS